MTSQQPSPTLIPLLLLLLLHCVCQNAKAGVKYLLMTLHTQFIPSYLPRQLQESISLFQDSLLLTLPLCYFPLILCLSIWLWPFVHDGCPHLLSFPCAWCAFLLYRLMNVTVDSRCFPLQCCSPTAAVTANAHSWRQGDLDIPLFPQTLHSAKVNVVLPRLLLVYNSIAQMLFHSEYALLLPPVKWRILFVALPVLAALC